jgi:hypothetical protein
MKINGHSLHPSVTLDRVITGAEQQRRFLDDVGFCIACGAEAMECEPDAERLTCEACEAPAVYGAEQLLIYLA